MPKEIIERLKKEFTARIGDTITGEEGVELLNAIIDELTIPKDVEYARKYLTECHRDMGFMGSPEYYKQRKIVDDYNTKIEERKREEDEKAEYIRLKSKFDK